MARSASGSCARTGSGVRRLGAGGLPVERVADGGQHELGPLAQGRFEDLVPADGTPAVVGEVVVERRLRLGRGGGDVLERLRVVDAGVAQRGRDPVDALGRLEGGR